MKFIKLSFKLAGQYKNRLKAGMLLIFLQNASVLFGFFALFLAFGWMNEITVGHIWTIFGVLFASFLFNFLTGWAKSGLRKDVGIRKWKLNSKILEKNMVLLKH